MSTTPTAEFPQMLRIDYNTENNTWGGILNANLDVIARAIGGWEEIVVGSGDISLSDTLFSTRYIALSGVLSTNINLIVPAQERNFIIQNSATGDFTVTVKTASGPGVAMPSGVGAIWPFQCDGAAVQIGLKIIDCAAMGQIRNFQSVGINDAAISTVITLTAANRMDLAAGTIFAVNDGILGSKYNSSTDIDHIWHDSATDTWYLVSSGTARTTDVTKASSLQAKSLALVNGGTLTVAGAGTFSSTLDVAGDATLTTLAVTGDVAVGGDLSGGGLGTAAYAESTDFSLSTHNHSDATPSAAGYMSAADKAKIDALPATVGFSNALLHVVDQKATNTQGGAFNNTVGGVERELQTILTNEIVGASVAANKIILPAGTYWIDASAPAHNVSQHKAKLYNFTASADVVHGSSEYAASSTVVTSSQIRGRFTLSATASLQIIHACQVTQALNGRGVASNLGANPEIYTVVSIWKI